MKFQAVAEKTAKDSRGLLYFAAPGIYNVKEKLGILLEFRKNVRQTESVANFKYKIGCHFTIEYCNLTVGASYTIIMIE